MLDLDPSATTDQALGYGGAGWQVGIFSHPGRVRRRNEDACLAFQFALVQHDQPPLPVGLFVVADGMGGHMEGQQASALACRLAAEHVMRQVLFPLLAEGDGQAERPPINEMLESSVQLAHASVSRRLPEAGTTLSMALVLGDAVYLAHVGDCRVYLGSPGQLRLLTRDHSMAARLLEMGQASSQEIASQRSILYRALGKAAEIDPDIVYQHLEGEGEYLLLCCDGLWGELDDAEMAAAVEMTPSPDAACRALVARANEKGGEDNITVIIAARTWPFPVGSGSPENAGES
jgi:serine/threonine protein phosphatase PrpC